MAIESNYLKEEQTKESIIDFVYNIIDSKIQYLNYQAKGIVRPLNLDDTSEDSIKGETDSDSISWEEVERAFLQFEMQSKQIKHLLYFRTLVNTNNAILALTLLTDNLLFEFTEKEIAYILDNMFSKQQAA